MQPTPLDYDGDGSVDLAVYGATPWHTYFDNGGYRSGIFTGGIRGDLAMSVRDTSSTTDSASSLASRRTVLLSTR